MPQKTYATLVFSGFESKRYYSFSTVPACLKPPWVEVFGGCQRSDTTVHRNTVTGEYNTYSKYRTECNRNSCRS